MPILTHKNRPLSIREPFASLPDSTLVSGVDVATMLSVPPAVVYKWRQSGLLPPHSETTDTIRGGASKHNPYFPSIKHSANSPNRKFWTLGLIRNLL